MKKGILFLLCLFPLMVVSAEEKESVTLSKCVDGDTAVFLVNGEEKKYRFLAIDTPESVHPTKGEEAFGKEASTFTCDALTNAKSIEVEYDEASGKQDKYGRGLAWIYVDGVMLQKTLIEKGLAEVAYIYGKYQYVDELCALQKTAISNKIGIWENGKRKEGYCKTKSNSTTKNTATKKVKHTKSEEDLFMEKTLELMKKYPVYAPFILVIAGGYFILKRKKK